MWNLRSFPSLKLSLDQCFDGIASKVQYFTMVFSETSDWISSLTHDFGFVLFYKFTNSGFFLIFSVIYF